MATIESLFARIPHPEPLPRVGSLAAPSWALVLAFVGLAVANGRTLVARKAARMCPYCGTIRVSNGALRHSIHDADHGYRGFYPL